MALRQQVESRRGGKNVTPPGIWGSHHMTHDHLEIIWIVSYFIQYKASYIFLYQNYFLPSNWIKSSHVNTKVTIFPFKIDIICFHIHSKSKIITSSLVWQFNFTKIQIKSYWLQMHFTLQESQINSNKNKMMLFTFNVNIEE